MANSISAADQGGTPLLVNIPRDYNAADDLIGRNLIAGRGDICFWLCSSGSTGKPNVTFDIIDKR